MSHYKKYAEDLPAFVLFMANTGLRPDEFYLIKYGNIDVRGKRGMGYSKSMTNAVLSCHRIVGRNQPEPMDKVFSVKRLRLFNTARAEEG